MLFEIISLWKGTRERFMTLCSFYKLSFPCEFNLSSLSCVSATMNMILSTWSYFCWILFCAPQQSLAPSGQQWPSTPKTLSSMACYQGIQAFFISRWQKKKPQNIGKDCSNLNCIFTKKWYNPNITPVKSIQCLRESESHQWWWMNQLASRLEEMATSQAQKEGKEDFTHFWIYDLIFKPKDKEAEAKQYEN